MSQTPETKPELTNEVALLLILCALVRRMGDTTVVRSHELLNIAEDSELRIENTKDGNITLSVVKR